MTTTVFQFARTGPRPTIRTTPSWLTLTNLCINITHPITKAIIGALFDLTSLALEAGGTEASTVEAMTVWFITSLGATGDAAVRAAVTFVAMALAGELIADTVGARASTGTR